MRNPIRVYGYLVRGYPVFGTQTSGYQTRGTGTQMRVIHQTAIRTYPL